MTVSALRFVSGILHEQKNKIRLTPQIDVAILLRWPKIQNEDITTIDGVKLTFDNWVHLRKSNNGTNNSYLYGSGFTRKADALALRIIDEIKAVAGFIRLV
jgi:phosphomannomutase